MVSSTSFRIRKLFVDARFWSIACCLLLGIGLSSGPVSAQTCYADNDGDGFGAGSPVQCAEYNMLGSHFIFPQLNAVITSSALDSKGGIIVGGDFGFLNGNTVPTRLMRLLPDGSIDMEFIQNMNININNIVNTIAIQSDGKILVGGSFTNIRIGGQLFNRMIRLNDDGSVDTSFRPNPGGEVHTIAVQADGKILIGGVFTNVGGTTRNRIARINADGSLDGGFNPNANSTVYSIAVQADGKILVGGLFTFVTNTGRQRFARLNSDGTLDGLVLNPNSTIWAITVQPDGKFLIGGDFTNIGGAAVNRLMRFNSDGSFDFSFGSNFNNSVRAISVLGNEKILVGGLFTQPVVNQGRNSIALLNSNGSIDSSFNVGIIPNGGIVSTITPLSDQSFFLGGGFSEIDGTTVGYNAIVRGDGRLIENPTPNIMYLNPVNQGDTYRNLISSSDGGRYFIPGSSASYLGRQHFMKLQSTGLLDSNFNQSTITQRPNDVKEQADGKVWVGGNSFLRRLNTDGSLDTNVSVSGIINTIAVQADGKILIGGTFTNVGGTTRNRIARLNADGSLDDGFNATVSNNAINTIAVQADGKILIGGTFTNVGGTTRNRIARLNTDGSLDDGFNASNVASNSAVNAIVVQADEKILIGGTFLTVGGQFYIAKLNTNGTLDTTFGITNAGGQIFSMEIDSGGNIYAAGSMGIIKITSGGNLDSSFNVAIGGDRINSVSISDNDILGIAGRFTTINGVARVGISTLDTDGNIPLLSGIVNSVDNNLDCDDTDHEQFPGQLRYIDQDGDGFFSMQPPIEQCLRPAGGYPKNKVLNQAWENIDLTTNLQAYYTFDNGNGSDSSGVGNHLGNAPLPVSFINEFINGSATFNGDNVLRQRLLVNSFNSQSFSVFGWVQIDNLNTERTWLTMGSSTALNNNFSLGVATNGSAYFRFHGANTLSTPADTIIPGKWHHIGITFNTNTYQQKIYVDGQLMGTANNSNRYMGNNTLYIGSFRGVAGTAWFGSLDDIRLYRSRIFSDQLVNQLYNRTMQYFGGTDCNDADATIYPGASEICDGIDNNCSGVIDDGFATTTYYRDADGDGFGDPTQPLETCEIGGPGSGWVLDNTDCNDNDSLEFPGQTWYVDFDRDGYSHMSAPPVVQCTRPNAGYKAALELIEIGTDCNDDDEFIHPGATETYNGIDQNCVNDAPEINASDLGNRTMLEDGVLNFSFRRGDVDNILSCTNPSHFSFLSSNTALVPVGNITLTGSTGSEGACYVTITPIEDAHGTTTITVVMDDGQLNVGENFLLTVTSVNDAPVGTDTRLLIPAGGSHTFSVGDFGFTDPKDTPSNSFVGVRFPTLPSVGTFTYAGSPVTINTEYGVAGISSLVYTPVVGQTGVPYSSLTFRVRDNGGTANGGIDLDLTARTLTIDVVDFQINNGNIATNSVVVSLTNITCPPNTQIAFGNTLNPAVRESCTSSKTHNLSTGDGNKTVYMRWRNTQTGQITNNISKTILLDTTAPTGGSFTINNDAVGTTGIAVTLNTVCATDAGVGGVQVAFGNSSNPGDWMSCSAAMAHNLTSGDGTKTVYMRFRDALGNTSTQVTDTILLDTIAPVGASMVAEPAFTSGLSNTVASTVATDAGVGGVQYQFCRNTTNSTSGCTSSGWTATPSHTFSSLIDGQIYYYFVRSRDSLGNTSVWSASTSSTQDNAAPVGGSFVINNDAAATSGVAVTLNTVCATDAGVGGVQVAFGNSSNPGDWMSCSAAMAHNLTSGDGTKTVYMRFRDALGNTSTQVTDTILLDTTAPVGASMVAEPAFTSGLSNTVASTVATDAGVGGIQYEFCRNTTNSTSGCTSSGWLGTTGHTFTGLIDGQIYYYFVRSRDSLGNTSVWSTSTSSRQDNSAPLGGSFVINNDAVATSGLVVTLNTVCAVDAGVGGVQVAYGNSSNTGNWTLCIGNAAITHTLTAGDGMKTVYMRRRDSFGYMTSEVTDTILLDTTAPVGASMVAEPAFTSGLSNTVASTVATDAGVGGVQYQFCRNTTNSTSGCTSSGWLGTTGHTFTGLIDGQIYYYFVRSRDSLGNTSVWSASTSSTQDNAAPVGGSFVINNDAAATSGVAVTLNTVCATDAGVGGVQVAFGNSSNPGDWMSCSAAMAHNLTSGDGTKTVYMRFRDAFGNTSTQTTDSILLDTVAPITSINENGASCAIEDVEIILSCDDGSGIGCGDTQFKIIDAAETCTATGLLTYTGAFLLDESGDKKLCYRSFDQVGNTETLKTSAVFTITDTVWYRDVDGDGYGDPTDSVIACEQPVGYVANNLDCNDTDALEFPGQTWYKDTDNDGYGDMNAAPVIQCSRPTGYKVAAELIEIDTDCNDAVSSINPGAVEIPADGIDQTCNGLELCYVDIDGDGFGSTSTVESPILSCIGEGISPLPTDCNDSDAEQFPGQTWYKDADGDGFSDGTTPINQCGRPTGGRYSFNELLGNSMVRGNYISNMVAHYSFDGTIQDQSGNDAHLVGSPTFSGSFINEYLRLNGTSELSSTLSGGLANNSFSIAGWIRADNLSSRRVWLSIGNGSTNNERIQLYVDTSGRLEFHFWNNNLQVSNPAFNIVPNTWYHVGYTYDASTNLMRVYVNGILADERVGTSNYIGNNNLYIGANIGQTWTRRRGDIDEVRIYQNRAFSEEEMNGLFTRVDRFADGDCDDANDAVYIGAPETCDEIDNNCNGLIDDEDPVFVGGATYYRDLDGDGFGDPTDSVEACGAPTGYVANNLDCNDNDALERPGQTWYKDADNDGYGDMNAAAVVQCLRPNGYKVVAELIEIDTDCNDADATVYPGATELDDGIDQNCVNDAPIVGPIADRTILEDSSTGVNYLLTDVDNVLSCTSTTDITFMSTNTALVPVANIVRGGTYPNCSFTVTPVANAHGTTTITVIADDGELNAFEDFELTVLSVNDAPIGADNRILWPAGNTFYTFKGADFGFSDPFDTPPNNFSALILESLPSMGQLIYSFVPVTSTGTEYSVATLNSLGFFSQTGGQATFDFLVKDDGGVENGGIDIDQVARTMTFDIVDFSINGGGTATNTVNVILDNIVCPDNTEIAISNIHNPFTWYWQNCESIKSHTLVHGDGNKTVYMRWRDTASGVGGAQVSKTILLDTTAPTGGSFTINNDAAATSGVAVTLNTVCATDAGVGGVQVAFGNSSNPSVWTGCSAAMAHNLASGDGTKTVYMRFRDSLGNTSTQITDTILLDTTAPVGASMVAEPAFTSGLSNTVASTVATDAGVGGIQYEFCRNTTNSTTGCTSSGWIGTPSHMFAGLTNGQIYYYFVRSRDSLGNTSVWSASTSSTQDNAAPTTTIDPDGGACILGATEVTLSCDDGTGIGCDLIEYKVIAEAATCDTTGLLTYTGTIEIAGAGNRKVCYRSTDMLGNTEALQTSNVFVITDTTYYRDADGDGYGDPNDSIVACAPPAGYVADNTDCNDADAGINPGAAEVCNLVDTNCSGTPYDVAQIPAAECEALIDLYDVTNGSGWTNNSGWLVNEDINTWHGVNLRTIGTQQHVDHILLHRHDITSTTPTTNAALRGNNLVGQLPNSIGNFSQMRRLYLNFNTLSGTLPDSLSNVSGLDFLYANNNNLSGPLPAFLGTMSSLRYIDLVSNNFNGSIDLLAGLPNLIVLSLAGNNFSGPLPTTMAAGSSLQNLHLHANSFTGPVPVEWGNLTNLRQLYLYNNNLSGLLPSSASNWTMMDYLYIYSNNFSGDFPDTSTWGNIRRLYIFNNNFTGPLPEFAAGANTRMQLYRVENNNFTGPIPDSYINFSAITDFRVHNNNLNRENTHNAVLTSAQQPWFAAITTTNRSNQGDITPPVISNLSPVASYVSGSFEVSFVIDENSYAVNLNGSGMSVNIGGGGVCSTLTTLSDLSVNTGTGMIVLNPGQEVEYAGCFITVTDFGNNVSNQLVIPTFEVDTTPPTGGSFTINNDAVATNTTGVVLNTVCAVDAGVGGVEVAYGNSSNPTNWMSCSASLPHELTVGDGIKTVSMRFTDALGNTTTDITDTILLDTTAPTTTIDPNGVVCATGAVSVTLSCDDGSGIGCDDSFYKIIDASETCSATGLLTYTGAFDIDGEGEKKVCYRSTDLLGNTETIQTSATFTISTTTYYRDADGDGYGDPNDSIVTCGQPAGYVVDNTDCNDNDAAINPGATEVCNAVDMNCNGDPYDVTQIPVQECLALIDFYDATNGSGWTNNSGWLENADISEWHGVRLLDVNGQNHVSHLLFHTSGTGTYNSNVWSVDGNNLIGTIPESIGDLHELRVLHLGGGTSATRNQISGTVPASIGNMTNLLQIFLGNNNLTGTIPDTFKQLENIQRLQLHNNNLTGEIQDWIGNWNSLQIIYLESNNFGGYIPESLSGATGLARFIIYSNQIGGTIPSYFGDTVKPSRFRINNNNFVGGIPDGLMGQNSFTHFIISHNYLDRTNTHDAYFTPTQQVWYDNLNVSNGNSIGNQGDITPPVISNPSSMPGYVSGSAAFSFDINENSYAIDLNGSGMRITIGGGGICSTLTTVSEVMINSGTTTIILNPAQETTYAGCTLMVTDFGDNDSNVITIPSFNVDLTPPVGGSFTINNDAIATSGASVTLNTTCPTDAGVGGVQVAFGNSSNPEDWINCSTVMNHDLTSGDGTKTVYMRFRDALGNTTAESTDTILLDTTGPVGASMIAEPAYTAGSTNTVATTLATDAGVGGVQYEFCRSTADNTTTCTSSGWTGSVSVTFTALADDQIYYYFVRSRDSLNNLSDWSASTSSTQDATPPVTTIAPDGGTCLTGSVLITLDCTDGGAGCDFSQYKIVDEAETCDTTGLLTYTGGIDLGGAGSKKICYRSTDLVGNVETIKTSNTYVLTDTVYYLDADGDGYGDPSETIIACTPPAGYVSNGDDCNDADRFERPGQIWYLDADGDGFHDGTIVDQCSRPSGDYYSASELIQLRNDTYAITSGLQLWLDAGDIRSFSGVNNTWFDLSNNANATLVNGPVYSTNSGGQIIFDGVDDFVQLGSQLTLQEGSTLHIRFASDITQTGIRYARLLGRNSVTQNRLEFEWYNRIFTRNNNGTSFTFHNGLTPTPSLNQDINDMYYVIDSSGIATLYINGQATTPTSGVSGVLLFDKVRQSRGLSDVAGRIEKVSIYDRELSDVEIEQNYKARDLDILDCADADAGIHPLTRRYKDEDGDGYSDGTMVMQCTRPDNYYLESELIAIGGDCNDTDVLEFPGQEWYLDADDDGYGAANTDSITQCTRPLNYKAAVELIQVDTDCNDANPAVNPGAPEVCDFIDNNCNGEIDEKGDGTYCTFCENIFLDVPQQECVALEALYTGSDWIFDTNWFASGTLQNRYGVTLTGSGPIKNIYGLNLAFNNMTGPLPEEISALTSLRTASLQNNSLTSIGGLAQLSGLEVLNIQGNQISSLPTTIGAMQGLEALYLNNNVLTALPNEFGDLSSLRILHLDNNTITTLPNNFANLDSLQFLRMGNNGLTALPTQIGNLNNLQMLYLNNNNLTTVPSSLGNIDALQVLNLSNNNITTLAADSFTNLEDLIELNLANNVLSTFAVDVSGLSSLERLYLQDNVLVALPNNLGTLTTLTHLQAQNNQLTSLPDDVSGWSGLMLLNLGNNELTVLPTSVSSLANLRHFFAQDNQLTGGLSLLAPLTGLQTLYLHNNTLQGRIPQAFDQMNNLFVLSVHSNALDRANTHDAIVSHLNPSRWNRPGFSRYIYDQIDVTPPTLTGTGSIDPFTILFAEYDIIWEENSYAVTTGGQGLPLQFAGATPLCTSLEVDALMTPIGAETISIISEFSGNYIGCTMTLVDHAGNMSESITLPDFYYSINIEDMCAHPELTIPTSECLVLVDLYKNTNGNAWTNRTGWFKTANVENRFGISTTAVSGSATEHVDGIFLHKSTGSDQHGATSSWNGNNLTGPLPANLGNLPYLVDLNLSNNNISGPLPASISNLDNLVTFYARNNQISGSLPSDIGLMSSLETFDLRVNQIGGTLPASIGQIAVLRGIDLSNNQLTGTLPTSLGDLSNLYFLSLANNTLNGAIPSALGNATALRYLYLQNNRLIGPIPLSFTQLTAMNAPAGTPIGANELNLSANNLNRTNTFFAEIPLPLQNRYNAIQTKNISAQGDITPPVISGTGSIPFDLTASGSATYSLTIDENSFAVASNGIGMPLVFGPSGLCSSMSGSRVTIKSGTVDVTIQPTQPGIYENCTLQLRDHGNNLSNSLSLPAFVYDMGDATVCFDPGLTIPRTECLALLSLYVSTEGEDWTNNTNWFDTPNVDNRFGINTSLVDGNERVTQLLLHRNDVTDAGDAIAPLTQGNNLSGTIDVDFASLPYLTAFRADDNVLGGVLPDTLAQASGLQLLTLSNNAFEETLPAAWSSLTSLTRLEVRNNNLVGAIPSTWSTLSALQTLDLGGNSLDGVLSVSPILWPSMEYLRLNDNMFSGPLPVQVASMTNLRELDLSTNEYAGGLPANWSGLNQLQQLNLSENALSLQLPAAWGSLGSLQRLEMTNNQLTGTIPATWTGMQTIQHIDLAGNALRGAITPEISSMSTLRYLDISDNRFSGLLPTALSGLNDLESFFIQGNAFARDINNDALISPALLAWYTTVLNTDISDQDDITPPVLSSNFTILSPVSNQQISYPLTITEESYYVNGSGMGLQLVGTGAANCAAMIVTSSPITSGGTYTLTILPTTQGFHACQLAVQDHGGNRGYHTMTPFIFDMTCGNGVPDPGEQCDEGRQCDDGRDCTNDSSICASECRPRFVDGCNPSCQYTFCGDGYVDTLGPDRTPGTSDDEFCDPGRICQVTGKDCTFDESICGPVDGACVVVGNSECSPFCGPVGCGDNVLDLAAGEQCDDGNTIDGDGCSSTCQVEFCGDGIVTVSFGEQCDLGPSNGAPGSPCDASCQRVTEESCRELCVDNGHGTGKHSILLIVDRSGSMQGGNKLQNLKNAANTFVDTLTGKTIVGGDWIHGSQVGLITINHQDPVFNIQPTDNFVTVKNAINAISAQGNLNIASGIQTARTWFANNVGDEKPVIVLLTDGNPTHPGGSNGARNAARSAADAAKADGIEIFTIGLQVNDVGRTLLQYIASSSQHYLEDQSNIILTEVYQSIYGSIHCGCAPFEEIEIMCGNGEVDNYSGSLAIHNEECDGGRFCDDRDTVLLTGTSCTIGGQAHCDGLGLGECRTRHTGTCTPTCRLPYCGDGFLDPSAGEECDDGNQVFGDGCSEECKIEFCGDGITQGALGEQCDLGAENGQPGSLCNANCLLVGCGDGITQSDLGEQCDTGRWCDDRDPILEDGTPCTDDPSICPGQCRTRFKNGCTPSCDFGFCGDGHVQDGEQCDVGSFCPNGVPCTHNPGLCPGQCQPVWTPTCAQDCQVPYCGDGFVDLDAGEQCDEGAMNGLGMCGIDCTWQLEPLYCDIGFSCPEGFSVQWNTQSESYYCLGTETMPAVYVCGESLGTCTLGTAQNINDTVCGTPDTWECTGVPDIGTVGCLIADSCTDPVCGSAFGECQVGNPNNLNDTVCGTPDTWRCVGVDGVGTANCSLADACACPWIVGNDSHINCNGSTAVVTSGNSLTLTTNGCYTTPETTADRFSYGYFEHCGPGTFQARINMPIGDNSFQGIMIRESEAPGSKTFGIFKHPTLTTNIRLLRQVENGNRTFQQLISPLTRPWVRIVRTNSQSAVYDSADGVNWDFKGAADTSGFNACLQYGVAVSSYNSNGVTSVTFDNITMDGVSNVCGG